MQLEIPEEKKKSVSTRNGSVVAEHVLQEESWLAPLQPAAGKESRQFRQFFFEAGFLIQQGDAPRPAGPKKGRKGLIPAEKKKYIMARHPF